MTIEILPLGDRAILVNFQQIIDPTVHQQVIGLSGKLEHASIEGVTFILPAYCSLTIGYNPEKAKYQDLNHNIRTLYKQPLKSQKVSGARLTLPVCYEEPFALDMFEISKFTGLKPEEIINIHTAQSYSVYMLGFLPGFPYLGILPEALHCSRKVNPRMRVPERSIGIAGQQTGIYPWESPGGWNIVGNTPLPIFDPQRATPFLFKVGDLVNFKAINKSEYQRIEADIRNENFSWDSING